MPILPKVTYRLNGIPNKIPLAYIIEIEIKDHPKIHTEPQRTEIAKAILRKNKAGGITVADFKFYFEVKVI